MSGITWKAAVGPQVSKHLVEEPDLIADVLIEQLGAPRFSWGGSRSLVNLPALRQDYIAALRQADRGDLSALLTFARTQ